MYLFGIYCVAFLVAVKLATADEVDVSAELTNSKDGSKFTANEAKCLKDGPTAPIDKLTIDLRSADAIGVNGLTFTDFMEKWALDFLSNTGADHEYTIRVQKPDDATVDGKTFAKSKCSISGYTLTCIP